MYACVFLPFKQTNPLKYIYFKRCIVAPALHKNAPDLVDRYRSLPIYVDNSADARSSSIPLGASISS